jgi:ubiquinone/menaquinone biosynthesis C-methylase UbiE
MHKIQRPDESFDFVVCDATLHHADNLVAVLRECRRVLKPGGWFIAFREPVISHWRLRPPVFSERYPEDGSAMYYYIDGWRSAWINSRYHNTRFTPFFEQRVVRGIRLSRTLQKWIKPLLLPLWMVAYPKVAMAAQKPLPSDFTRG